MHKSNSNQQQPCLPCLFHISSFALPSTGASKDKRVQVGNETPDNGWKLCVKATHLLSLFLFFLHLLQLLLPAAFLQAEEKASRSKREPLERRRLRGSRLPLDRWGESNAETQAQHAKFAGNGWKWGPSVMTQKLSDRAEGVVYVVRTGGISRIIHVGALSLYLVLFPLFLHLTHSSQEGCWLRGLSNIWHCSSERDVGKVHSPWRGEAPDMPDSKAQHQKQFFALTHRSKIKPWVTLRQ